MISIWTIRSSSRTASWPSFRCPWRRGLAGREAGEAATAKTGFFSSVAGRALVIAAIGVGLYLLIVPGQESSPIR
ncbi:MAG: hypothetical protein M0C28_08215 [Candidatus Moduliflexus flocculans]|nr:hypothetical protein [Candidatus Moduliflexus flocculans]